MQRVSSRALFIREIIVTLFFLTGIILLGVIWPASVGTNPNSQLPEKVAAPWIFGPIQVLLIYLPAWIAGLLIPSVIVLALFGLPWLYKIVGERGSRIAFTAITLFVLGLLLWFLGLEYWRA